MLVDINLLPQKERNRPAFIIAAFSILLLAIAIWAILFFMAQSQAKEQASMMAQSVQLASEQAAIRQQLEATTGLNEEQQLKATVDWAESYQYDTIPLLAELVAFLPERGFFNNFSYIGPNEAVLTLQFDTSREAAYYLTQLKTSELLASASLDNVAMQEQREVTEETEVVENDIVVTPRYLATYSLVFVDQRIPAEGSTDASGETIPGAPELPEPEESIETEITPEETPVPTESAPAETGDGSNE